MRNKSLTPVITIFLVILIYTSIQCQRNALGCEGNRYIQEIFTATTLTTTVYAETELIDGTPVQLEMDIFLPEGDTSSKRPVVLLAHSEEDGRSEMYANCEMLAKRGFIAASIDYRRQEIERTYNEWFRDGIRKTQDMKAAVRFFRKDFNTDNLYRADTNFIFVGGFSIGGVMGLTVAYLDEDDPEDTILDSLIALEGGLIGYPNEIKDVSSKVQGVLNLSGSILYTKWIDEGEPAVASFHGTADSVIPIGYGSIDNVFDTYGSTEIHAEATLKGILNYFHPVEGAGHFDIYGPKYVDEFEAFIQTTIEFCKDSILCNSSITSNSFMPNNDPIVNIFPNPASNYINIEYHESMNYEFVIYNSLGQVLLSRKLTGNDTMIKVAHFPPAIHYYIIKNGARNIQSGKLVISKEANFRNRN